MGGIYVKGVLPGGASDGKVAKGKQKRILRRR